MIQIRILRTKKQIVGFEVKGHAGYDEYGKDLVCAGVSAITVGGLNAVAHYFQNDLSHFQVKMSEGYTSLTVQTLNNEQVQTVLETLVIQFKTIEETYSKYIQIMEQEVHSQ